MTEAIITEPLQWMANSAGTADILSEQAPGSLRSDLLAPALARCMHLAFDDWPAFGP